MTDFYRAVHPLFAVLATVERGARSTDLNATIQRLTVLSTVFLPLTFVTGFFGQNFGWLVDHVDGLGDFVALGLGGLLIPCIALFFWFRRERADQGARQPT